MKSSDNKDVMFWLTIILGLSTLVTIALQIALSGNSSTKTETALFNILQFVLSLGFAWLLSRTSFKKEFEDGQKRFAIAAYRRIREIEKTSNRLLVRTSNRPSDISDDLAKELDVINQISLGIKDSVTSSIADWADIIGDEIVAVEKIEEYRKEQEELADKTASTPVFLQEEGVRLTERIESLNSQIENIQKSLPVSLQIIERNRVQRELYINELSNDLRNQLVHKGYIELQGFWSPIDQLEENIMNFSAGDMLSIRTGDVGNRIGILVAYDDKGDSVGIILNSLAGPYRDFAWAVKKAMGRSAFKAEIVSINSSRSNNIRTYFTLKVFSDNAARQLSLLTG